MKPVRVETVTFQYMSNIGAYIQYGHANECRFLRLLLITSHVTRFRSCALCTVEMTETTTTKNHVLLRSNQLGSIVTLLSDIEVNVNGKTMIITLQYRPS